MAYVIISVDNFFNTKVELLTELNYEDVYRKLEILVDNKLKEYDEDYIYGFTKNINTIEIFMKDDNYIKYEIKKAEFS